MITFWLNLWFLLAVTTTTLLACYLTRLPYPHFKWYREGVFILLYLALHYLIVWPMTVATHCS